MAASQSKEAAGAYYPVSHYEDGPTLSDTEPRRAGRPKRKPRLGTVRQHRTAVTVESLADFRTELDRVDS